MPNFDHLQIPIKLRGDYDTPFAGGRKKKNPRTESNLTNRKAHGSTLSDKVEIISKSWLSTYHKRTVNDLPPIPNAYPLFLQIDPEDFDPDTLRVFGIEVIAEEEDGFIIGASADIDLNSLKQKIEEFIKNEGRSKNTAAKLWDITEGNQWRVDQILSESLQEKWDAIEDDRNYILNVGIACFIKIPDYPSRKKGENETEYQERIEKWESNRSRLSEERDDLLFERGMELQRFIEGYEGELLSSLIDLNDSFCCQLRISGKGFKDLVFNYPYLFEVEEAEPVDGINFGEGVELVGYAPTLLPPTEDAPKVCVIDSGIQEAHRLLSPAIDITKSKCFVPDEEGIADFVSGGGHGTRVAGIILFPSGVPKEGNYQMPCWIQNARVLDQHCRLHEQLYPPALMEKIVGEYHRAGTKIFNLSINALSPHRLIHTSAWAATIDKLSWENDLLFVISTGNIRYDLGLVNSPGIEHYLRTGRDYPDYLFEKSCRIANPGHSAQAITVGSICFDKYEDEDSESFGRRGEPSAFTRVGPGIWGMIKPDVVEYGGDYVRNKSGHPNIRVAPQTCPELVRSVLSGGPAVSRDDVGTSYAAPKVTHIIALLQRSIPEGSALLYRALLVQSARWPEWAEKSSENLFSHLRYLGYGIPDSDRSLRNSEYRVTFVGEDSVGPSQAHVYSVRIPDNLRRPGDSFRIRIEVTLSYKAIPRRTRRRTKSYLSNWLHWEPSKIGESLEAFQSRILRHINLEKAEEEDTNTLPWIIKQRRNQGVKEVNLSESTIQKDWCYIESNQLPPDFGLAIVGHKGWEKDRKAEVPYAVVVSFEAVEQDIQIYEQIRVENEVEIHVR
jgi:hypothetical protein